MALFRRLFYRKPPDRLLEITDRVYVFDCCFSSETMEEDDYHKYIDEIVFQLREHFPDASFLVINFEGEVESNISHILSHYDITTRSYPRHYEGCPVLPLEIIHHFLRLCESWLTFERQQNVLMMHCERGGWPILAFMLASLLLYRRQYSGEQRTLEMVYKQAPKELLQLLSPLNPQPSHIRYLQYISKIGSDSWPPQDTPFTLDCLILRVVPNFDGRGGCRPIVRVYGQDPLFPADRSSKLLFSTAKTRKHVRHYRQAENAPIKLNVRCCVQGDLVLECINVDEYLEEEVIMFRVMFNTTFVQSYILMLTLEDIDTAWDAKDRFPKDFNAEVLFSEFEAGSDSSTEMGVIVGDDMEVGSTEEFFEAEEIFSSPEWHDGQRDLDMQSAIFSNTLEVFGPLTQGSGPDRNQLESFTPEQFSLLDDGILPVEGSLEGNMDRGYAKQGKILIEMPSSTSVMDKLIHKTSSKNFSFEEKRRSEKSRRNSESFELRKSCGDVNEKEKMELLLVHSKQSLSSSLFDDEISKQESMGNAIEFLKSKPHLFHSSQSSDPNLVHESSQSHMLSKTRGFLDKQDAEAIHAVTASTGAPVTCGSLLVPSSSLKTKQVSEAMHTYGRPVISDVLPRSSPPPPPLPPRPPPPPPSPSPFLSRAKSHISSTSEKIVPSPTPQFTNSRTSSSVFSTSPQITEILEASPPPSPDPQMLCNSIALIAALSSQLSDQLRSMKMDPLLQSSALNSLPLNLNLPSVGPSFSSQPHPFQSLIPSHVRPSSIHSAAAPPISNAFLSAPSHPSDSKFTKPSYTSSVGGRGLSNIPKASPSPLGESVYHSLPSNLPVEKDIFDKEYIGLVNSSSHPGDQSLISPPTNIGVKISPPPPPPPPSPFIKYTNKHIVDTLPSSCVEIDNASSHLPLTPQIVQQPSSSPRTHKVCLTSPPLGSPPPPPPPLPPSPSKIVERTSLPILHSKIDEASHSVQYIGVVEKDLSPRPPISNLKESQLSPPPPPPPPLLGFCGLPSSLPPPVVQSCKNPPPSTLLGNYEEPSSSSPSSPKNSTQPPLSFPPPPPPPPLPVSHQGCVELAEPLLYGGNDKVLSSKQSEAFGKASSPPPPPTNHVQVSTSSSSPILPLPPVTSCVTPLPPPPPPPPPPPTTTITMICMQSLPPQLPSLPLISCVQDSLLVPTPPLLPSPSTNCVQGPPPLLPPTSCEQGPQSTSIPPPSPNFAQDLPSQTLPPTPPLPPISCVQSLLVPLPPPSPPPPPMPPPPPASHVQYLPPPPPYSTCEQAQPPFLFSNIPPAPPPPPLMYGACAQSYPPPPPPLSRGCVQPPPPPPPPPRSYEGSSLLIDSSGETPALASSLGGLEQVSLPPSTTSDLGHIAPLLPPLESSQQAPSPPSPPPPKDFGCPPTPPPPPGCFGQVAPPPPPPPPPSIDFEGSHAPPLPFGGSRDPPIPPPSPENFRGALALPPLPGGFGGAPPPPPPIGGFGGVPPPPPPPPPGGFGGAPPPPPPIECFGGPPPPPPPPPGGFGGVPPPPPPIGCFGGAPPPPPPPGGFGGVPPPPPIGCFGGAPPPPPPPGGFGGVPPPIGGFGGAPTPPPPPGGFGRAPPPPLPGGAPPPPPIPGGGPPPPPGGPGAPPPPPGSGMRGSAPNPLAGGRGRPMGPGAVARKSPFKPLHWVKVTKAMQGSLWAELQKHADAQSTSEFDVSELETLFSAVVPKPNGKSEGKNKAAAKSDKVHLVDLRRANNTEIMLTKIKMPLPEMMNAVLELNESLLDGDQVENLIKFCPTKEEMELLKGYTGNIENLGKCEQFFLELMTVPRVESKLRVFAFKIQFNAQMADIKKSLHIVDSACDEVRNSDKLKEIMKKILYLGNTLNQGTARGSAVGFRLDSLLKLTDTRATNNKMTLMHYLCKVLAEKSPQLLDFYEAFISLEAASKIPLKSVAEEQQQIVKGLDKVEQELKASESDGPVSETFCKTLKEFTSVAAAQVASLTALNIAVAKNADSLALYFGEDPTRCPFEQVVSTLLNFIRLFRRAHEENCKQAELEKKKAEDKAKEAKEAK